MSVIHFLHVRGCKWAISLGASAVLGAALLATSYRDFFWREHHRPPRDRPRVDPNDGGAPQPSPQITFYDIQVKGDVYGQGSASVSGNSLIFVADIKDDSGNAGTFAATATVVNSHFQGTGTALGQPVLLSGRIDLPDLPARGKSLIRTARIMSTFSFSNEKFGRIAGSAFVVAADDQRHDH